MKILVTGGCGFLGTNIAASYLDDAVEVIVIDKLFRKGGIDNLEWLKGRCTNSQLTHYDIDLAEDDAVRAVFRKHAPFDYVCHLGGQVAMTTSLSDPRRDFRTNALGTFNVLEAVREFSPEALVAYSSTNKVYGDLAHLKYAEEESRYSVPAYPLGFDESLPLDFASPYGCSKGAADQYVRDWYRNFGVRTVVFRHSSIYGGRQFSTFDQGWIGWFCRMALEQKAARYAGRSASSFTIAGTGKQVRDVLHADDLVSLYRAAFLAKSNVSGEIFNIGGGVDNSLSLLELFQLLTDLTGVELSYIKNPRRQSDQDYFVADIRKATRLLGWQPTVATRNGVLRMLDWVGK